MTEHKICDVCNGNKQYMGLGLMKVNCRKCDGKGFVEINDNAKSDIISQEEATVDKPSDPHQWRLKESKRRGRPKMKGL